jgi:hypothetical protein
MLCRKPSRLHLAAPALVLATLSLALPAPAVSATRTYSPVKLRGDIAVFRLAGLKPAAVLSARVTLGRSAARVKRAAVRRAARRGTLRIRLSKLRWTGPRPRLHTRRGAGRRHGKRGRRDPQPARARSDRARGSVPKLKVTTLDPPTVTITSAPPSPTESTDASIAFTTSGAKRTKCLLDLGGWTACASPVAYHGLASGDHTFTVRVTNRAGSATASTSWTILTPISTPPAGDPVIAAAGDIACASFTVGTTSCHQGPTSDLLVGQGLAGVLTLGDNQYDVGALSAYNSFYDPTWGRANALAHPIPGNHEYGTSGAAGYFDYFGSKGVTVGNRGEGYYSYDIGAWHLIALNSEIAHDSASAEVTWLKADLATHPNACTLAYWHKPRFSSGNAHGSDSSFQPFWDALYNANAELVLNGHEHNYERFAPQTPIGQADSARGVREFVSGTGGRSHYGFGTPIANSQVRNSDTFGVLKLTLHAGSYNWQFVRDTATGNGMFADSGTGSCH